MVFVLRSFVLIVPVLFGDILVGFSIFLLIEQFFLTNGVCAQNTKRGWSLFSL